METKNGATIRGKPLLKQLVTSIKYESEGMLMLPIKVMTCTRKLRPESCMWRNVSKKILMDGEKPHQTISLSERVLNKTHFMKFKTHKGPKKNLFSL